MESAWFAIFGTLVGAIIGAVPTIVIGKMNLKAEKERQMRELGLQMALVEYQVQCQVRCNPGDELLPPVAFIGTAYQAVRKLMGDDLDIEQFEKVYKETSELVVKYGKVVHEHSAKPEDFENG